MDVFEVINTTRAMRRLKPDPVPDELVWKLLDAAIRAPSGGNRQPWNFIVVRDETAKKKIAQWYLEAWNASYGPMKDAMASNPDSSRMFNSADHLANHLAEVPVLILAAIRGGDTGTSPAGSYVYPAIQNMMLAARALGLGTHVPAPMAVYATCTIDRLRQALSTTDLALVAEVDGEVAGLLILVVPEWTDAAEITDLAIDIAFRRLGAGHALIEAAADWARGRGYRALWVEPRADNHAALPLYRSPGLRP